MLFVVILSIVTVFVSSQNCLAPKSPNNPPNCNTPQARYFRLGEDRFNPCICCGPIIDDNPPDKCMTAPFNYIETGSAICNTNYDCCTCNSITCNDCSSMKCSGDSSCIGIKNIIINGNCNLAGSEIDCNGDLACFRTKIIGECINALKCSGDNSCGQSEILINQINNNIPDIIKPIDFLFDGDNSVPNSMIKANNVGSFRCAGDGSCENVVAFINCKLNDIVNGCGLFLAGDNAAQGSTFNVNNVNEILIQGDQSAVGVILDINCVNSGCLLKINNEESAKNSNIKVTNVNSIQCAGVEACSNSVFNIICTTNGCPITCESSCYQSNLFITNSNGILCNGVITFPPSTLQLGSCERTTINLDNNRGGTISCAGTKACKLATITNSLNNPINNIASILCDTDYACESALIKVNALNNQFILSCKGTESCLNSILTIFTQHINIKLIDCSGIQACRKSNIIISPEFSRTIDIENIICGSMNSCFQANIVIDLRGFRPNANFRILCNGVNSCNQMNINIVRNGFQTSRFEASVVCVPGNCDRAFINGRSFDNFV